MKTKTCELTGPTLDWAVAKCEGHCEAFDKAEQACPNATWVFSRGGMREFIEELKREVPEELK